MAGRGVGSDKLCARAVDGIPLYVLLRATAVRALSQEVPFSDDRWETEAQSRMVWPRATE